MSVNVKTSQKYYCLEPERLSILAEQNGFKIISKLNEVDEYFTDIDGNLVNNRTCLRIRKNSLNKIIVTYKEESDSLFGRYCKLENNIMIDKNEYDNYVNLFSSLGYYSYIEVVKDRIVYKMDKDKYSYNIMLDNLNLIGGFVEFEVSTSKKDISKEEITGELNRLISKFNNLKLKEAKDNYREIVAKYEKDKYDKDTDDLYINIDCEVLKYEKKFFNNYKTKISKQCKSNIKWGEYKKNEQIGNQIIPLINEYFDNLIIDDNQLLLTMKLLKQLPYQKHFVTKVNKTFYAELLKKIGFDNEEIIFVKTDNYYKTFKDNNIDIKENIFINEKDIKIINSILLVMLNN